MTTICAIDPGASGGIAWCVPGEKPCCVPMPETEGDLILRLVTIVSRDGSTVFYLEDLVKHMGAGIPASTMAVYASNWGFIKGAIQYSGSPLHIVNPRTWAKSLGLGTATQVPGTLKSVVKREWKNKLKARAQQLYPHLEVTLKTADALLLLEFAIKEQRVA